jgi:hypothetical protein
VARNGADGRWTLDGFGRLRHRRRRIAAPGAVDRARLEHAAREPSGEGGFKIAAGAGDFDPGAAREREGDRIGRCPFGEHVPNEAAGQIDEIKILRRGIEQDAAPADRMEGHMRHARAGLRLRRTTKRG